MKPTLLYSLALIGIFAVGLMVYPRVITGDYAKIQIDKIEITPDGRIDVSYSGIRTSGSYLTGVSIEQGRPPRESGSISGEIGLGYPRQCREEDIRWSPPVVQDLSQHLLVKEGEAYEIKIDQPLILFDMAPQKGRHNKGTIKLVRQDSCRF